MLSWIMPLFILELYPNAGVIMLQGALRAQEQNVPGSAYVNLFTALILKTDSFSTPSFKGESIGCQALITSGIMMANTVSYIFNVYWKNLNNPPQA
jgi:hypothetical protein